MKPKETVQTFITALQSGDMDMAAQYIAGDFVFEGWTPQALDKGELSCQVSLFVSRIINMPARGNSAAQVAYASRDKTY